MYCYHEFKLLYLKNHELFSITVKELFEPIVLRKKTTSFCSFQKHFLEKPFFFFFFFFYGKKYKIGK